MRDIIFTFFNYFVFFYTSMLAIFFVTFAFLSFISLKRRKDYYVESYMRKTIKESPYTPGISVIAPAFNEEKTIIDNVNSMLALEYPLFEVVIVNDGSTDSTLEKMTEYYELVEVPYAYIERIKTRPFRRLLKSSNPKYSRLIVVDKENGGTKADASNAGINVASHPYFICTDVDCILEKYALYRCISPIISSEKQVIAVSGTMLMANGCVVKDGQIIDVRTPRTPIPLFQNLEYMRSYLIGKMGWSAINGMPNVSGGFGLFDRSVAIAAGGYDAPSFAEDIYRQRTRWARGLFQTLNIHRKMIFKKTYKQMGLLTLPYMFVFEFLAPIIELVGLIVFIYLAFTGAVNWNTAWMIYLTIYTFCQFLSIVVITYDYYVGMLYKRGYEYLWIIIASILEPIFYHPIITFCSLRGYLSYLTNRDFKWKNMERKGFKQKEESADGTDITAMKPEPATI